MPTVKILIINPNTTQSMTDGLRAPVESLGYNNVNPLNAISPTTSSQLDMLTTTPRLNTHT